MPNETRNRSNLAIPTYDEAIASQPPTVRGASQISDDAERQGLLRVLRPGSYPPPLNQRDGRGAYRAPIVEDARESIDSSLTSPRLSDDEDEDELRRHIEEMDIDDSASHPVRSQRHALQLPKALQNLRETLSAISLPSFGNRIQFVESLMARLPPLPARLQLSWPIIGKLIGLFIIVAFIYGLVVFKILTPASIAVGQHYDLDAVRTFAQSNIDPKAIERYLREMTFDAHIAGTKGDFYLAQRVEEYMTEAGLDAVYQEDYEVFLNYPRTDGRRVAIIEPEHLRWEAKLEEDRQPFDEGKHPSLVFHGNSKAGDVTGPLIYANYGSRDDFARLKDAGIDLEGSVVIVRYYGTQGDRALKVKAAELAGAAGCLIYSDPGDDGYVRGPVWPDGPWRPEDSVQRGSVALMSWVVGDVLTPGWASTQDAERIAPVNSTGLVGIPSLPLSWRDAKVLIRALKDHGQRVWEGWEGGDKEIEWFTGDDSSPVVHLRNLQDENQKQPIRNILGKIQGIESPEKLIYVGNHRDAWSLGAADPGSGTAVLLEVIRVFGLLVEQGWRPRRSIVFASWDAEEYNLIGSTEHVEDRLQLLREHGVAYINVDTAVVGSNFEARASPLFQRPLLRTLARVAQPGQNKSLLQAWDENESRLDGLGAGSDYVAFQDLVGTSSIDFGFSGEPFAFPYHSSYDSFEWMRTMADPDFTIHATAAEVWSLLILDLADEPILTFDFPFYASEVKRYIDDLKKDIEKISGRPDTLNLTALYAASQDFITNADAFGEFEKAWNRDIAPIPMMEAHDTAILRMSHNTRMSNFETHLLDLPYEDEEREGGIPGRTQFKHVIFGPQLWSGYDEAFFPGVRDMMDIEDWDAAQKQVDITAELLRRAAWKLIH